MTVEALSARLDALEERVSRDPLGAHPDDRRLACPCTQVLGLLHVPTGEVRWGYRGHVALYFTPSSPFVVYCKRCQHLVQFDPRGELVGTLQPTARPGDPRPR